MQSVPELRVGAVHVPMVFRQGPARYRPRPGISASEPVFGTASSQRPARVGSMGTRTWLRHRLFCSPNRAGGGSFGSGDENRSVTAVPASPATTAVSSAAGPDTPCLATGVERVVAPIAVPVRTPDGVLMSPGVPGISCGRCPLCRSVSSANLVTPRQARCVATAPQQSPSLASYPGATRKVARQSSRDPNKGSDRP